jgi:hypothetical protein
MNRPPFRHESVRRNASPWRLRSGRDRARLWGNKVCLICGADLALRIETTRHRHRYLLRLFCGDSSGVGDDPSRFKVQSGARRDFSS